MIRPAWLAYEPRPAALDVTDCLCTVARDGRRYALAACAACRGAGLLSTAERAALAAALDAIEPAPRGPGVVAVADVIAAARGVA